MKWLQCPTSACVGNALWRSPSPNRLLRFGNLFGAKLLNLHFGACFFELLLDRRGFVLVHAFLDRLGSAIYQVLGFFQTQARNFPDRLDDVDLVAANLREHDREFCLLFRRGSTAARRSATA